MTRSNKHFAQAAMLLWALTGCAGDEKEQEGDGDVAETPPCGLPMDTMARTHASTRKKEDLTRERGRLVRSGLRGGRHHTLGRHQHGGDHG